MKKKYIMGFPLPFQKLKEINKTEKQNRERKNCPERQSSVKTVYAFILGNKAVTFIL